MRPDAKASAAPRGAHPSAHTHAARHAHCLHLLVVLERVRPGCLPAPRDRIELKPGEAGPPVTVDAAALTELVRAAVAPADGSTTYAWSEAGDEVLVHADRTRIVTRDGIAVVGLTLECLETDGPTEVAVPFAVGAPDRLAGMVAVTETHPRGPAILVDRWGDAIVACAWQALLDVADGIAAGTGRDIDGHPLRAGALVATRDGLIVHPQAPHPFERAPVAAAPAPRSEPRG